MHDEDVSQLVEDLIQCLDRYYQSHSKIDKASIINSVAKELGFTRKRSVFVAQSHEYSVRFSYVAGASGFSNTVLALSTLLEYDEIPFVVCILRPTYFELRLANTSCLSKISHSSHALTETNIKGSFLGNDILKEIGSLPNAPENFDAIFSRHKQIGKEENIQRLVQATSSIVPNKSKFPVTEERKSGILASVRLSCSETVKPYLDQIKTQLDSKIEAQYGNIFNAAVDNASNVNLRGNKIEQLITDSFNKHEFFDTVYNFGPVRIGVDIKTSIAGLTSSPKNCNVDKLLEELSDGRTLSFIYVVYIDVANRRIFTHLINNFDSKIIDGTRVQFHWAGRDSRGVTQLDASLHHQFGSDWKSSVSEQKAEYFVKSLIKIGEGG